MPRLFARPAPPPGEPTPPPKAQLRVLRADGARIDLTKRDTGKLLAATKQTWQETSYQYRDLIGELRYAVRLLARSVARARFYPAATRPWPADPAPLADDDHQLNAQLAADAVTNFDRLPMDSNPDGFTARLVENLALAGEAWPHLDADDRWWVRSVSEITAGTDGRVSLAAAPGAPSHTARLVDPNNEDLLRIWVPHPQWGQLADSPMRSLLDVAEDVVLAGREQRAAARSRLAANGVLFIPDTMTLARTRDEDDDDTYDDSIASDSFMADFEAAVVASVMDDGAPQMVVPIVIRGDRDDIAAVKHVTFERSDSEQLIARQGSAILRLLKGLDIQPEQVEGLGSSNHWCVDEETEALTRRGWVGQSDLRIGDDVLTLNHETGLSEWKPVLDIYRADVIDEPMAAMENRTHSSLTTHQHRWPVLREHGGKNRNVNGEVVDGRHKRREWATSDSLTRRDWIPTCAVSADRPTDAKYADDFVELVGWFWTEGNIGPYGAASIAQSHTRNPARVDRIRAALTRTYGPGVDNLTKIGRPAWREAVQPNKSSFGGPITVFYLNATAAAPLIDACPRKLVSPDFVHALTPAQLELFIDVSAQGDGWHYRSGRLDMWQRDSAALDGYELALILTGRMVSRGVSNDGHWVSPHAKRQVNPIKACEEGRRQGRDAQVTERRYTGVVWCPTTENRTWFARRRGTTYFTGNSAWLIESQSVRHQVQPMAETVAYGLAAAYLRPALLALGHPADEVAKVTIGVDVTPLTDNPNRGQDARDAHAAAVISDDALRRELGFDDDDKPTDDEVIRRLAINGRLSQETTEMILGLSRPGPRREQITVQGETVPTGLPQAGERPAAQPGQLHPERTTPAAPTNEQPPGPVVAAALPAEDWVVDEQAARRLTDIDAALTERVLVAADAALQRVAERAGAKVRSAARNNKTITASLAGVDAHLIPATLGRERVESLTSIPDLIADSYTRLRAQLDGWLVDAAGQTADTVCAILGLDPRRGRGRDVRAQVRNRLAATRDRAWPILAEALDAAAEDALFPQPAEENPGETSDALIDPLDIVDALAAAGGAIGAVTAAGGGYGGRGRTGRARRKRRDPRPALNTVLPTTPAGGVATGPVVHDIITDNGGVLLGWQWDYRPELARTVFDPHKQLDGARFLSWRDPILATSPATAWIGTHFHPRDHAGCLCTGTPLFAAVADPESALAQAIRDAHGQPDAILVGGTPGQGGSTGGLRDRARAAVDDMRANLVRRKGRR